MRESLKRAQANYASKCKMFTLRINKETEPDILHWMEQPGAGTRIKQLIREDLKSRS